MKKFIKKNRRFIAIGLGYLVGFVLFSICSFLYFYFQSPLVLVDIIVLIFVVSYLMPIWFRWFLKARPYKGSYKNQLMKFSEDANVPIKEIYVRKSTKSNACAVGYWNTSSVIFNSHTLEQHPYDEVEAVMGHELGHHRNKDVYLYTTIIAIILVGGSWFNVVINSKFNSNLWLTSFIISIILLPIALLISRWREGLADLYGKKILKEPSALARFFERSIDFEKKEGIEIPKNPNFISRIFLTHPWVYDRIRFLKE